MTSGDEDMCDSADERLSSFDLESHRPVVVPRRLNSLGDGDSVSSGTSSKRSSRRVTFDPNVLLRHAVQEGDFATFKALLQPELCVDGEAATLCGSVTFSRQRDSAVDLGGDSLLCASQRNSQPRLADLDLNLADNDGLTLMHLCCFAGAVDWVRVLLDCGAEVDAIDEAGWTPLHVASAEGLSDAVQMLAAAGARLDVRDYDGYRPEDVAADLQTREVFENLGLDKTKTMTSVEKESSRTVA